MEVLDLVRGEGKKVVVAVRSVEMDQRMRQHEDVVLDLVTMNLGYRGQEW